MVSLWLDDERDPNKPFIQQEFGAQPGMIWVKTAPEAITYLQKGNVGYISIDHDLGVPETGYDLAKWIEEQAYNGKLPPLQWTVHSQNMIGRRNIITAMKNADRYWQAAPSQPE